MRGALVRRGRLPRGPGFASTSPQVRSATPLPWPPRWAGGDHAFGRRSVVASGPGFETGSKIGPSQGQWHSGLHAHGVPGKRKSHTGERAMPRGLKMDETYAAGGNAAVGSLPTGLTPSPQRRKGWSPGIASGWGTPTPVEAVSPAAQFFFHPIRTSQRWDLLESGV